MNKKKLFNDPIYGFITFSDDILYDIIDHPNFQRLRRISQLGLTNYVYPGATHTRFHHSLGACHLMHKALNTLLYKGVSITKEEVLGAKLAILLHDIGHGPFSHVLENTLVKTSHEEISLAIMQKLNKQFSGQLDVCISIFKKEYPKTFLSQLVSGELDVDRLDYLTRDSFYTGVAEGIIGYDRILQMINVHEGKLVVEEKGKYSIEKFLLARKIMFGQVYLHKTVIAADQMLISFLERYKELYNIGKIKENNTFTSLFDLYVNNLQSLDTFVLIDDVDILYLIKRCAKHSDDEILKFLSKGLLNRHLFKIKISDTPFDSDFVKQVRQKVSEKLNLPNDNTVDFLVRTGIETSNTNKSKDEICILDKTKSVKPVSEYLLNLSMGANINKYYLSYPRIFQ